MIYNIIKIVNYVGPHRLQHNWMYQDFVLFLVWWWLVAAETCCQVFNSADLIHVVLLTVVYCYTVLYEGWSFNSGNYLFTTDTK